MALAALTVVAYPLVDGCHIDPVKASWSGKVRPDSGVGQGLTCNFDTPIYAEFFTGLATDQQYQAEIRIPGRTPPCIVADGIADGDGRSHVWVKCTLEVRLPDSIIKGRLFEVRWTLDGGPDSLVYYYDSTDAYEWGQIVLPGQQAPTDDPRDLASRVYGILDPIDSTFWGMNSGFACWEGPYKKMWVDSSRKAGVGMMRVEQLWFESETTAGNYAWGSLDCTCCVELFLGCACAPGESA